MRPSWACQYRLPLTLPSFVHQSQNSSKPILINCYIPFRYSFRLIHIKTLNRCPRRTQVTSWLNAWVAISPRSIPQRPLVHLTKACPNFSLTLTLRSHSYLKPTPAAYITARRVSCGLPLLPKWGQPSALKRIWACAWDATNISTKDCRFYHEPMALWREGMLLLSGSLARWFPLCTCLKVLNLGTTKPSKM